MSRPAEDRAIVGAGLNSLAFDSGPPLVCDKPAATYERASDEHGRLAVSAATNRLGLGDKIRLIPGHCDSTVNSTTGMSASAATASSSCGRSPPAAPFIDLDASPSVPHHPRKTFGVGSAQLGLAWGY
jgi:Putative serine dehydratase domain